MGCKGKIILSNETKRDKENKIMFLNKDNPSSYSTIKDSLIKLYNENKCPFGNYSLKEKNKINKIGPKGERGERGEDADPCLKFGPDDKITDVKCLNKLWN